MACLGQRHTVRGLPRWALNIASVRKERDGADGSGGGFCERLDGVSQLCLRRGLFLAIESCARCEEDVDTSGLPKGLIFGNVHADVSACDHVLNLRRLAGTAASARRVLTGDVGERRSMASASSRDDIQALSMFAVIGLIASLHTIIFCVRRTYSLSRAGYTRGVVDSTARAKRRNLRC